MHQQYNIKGVPARESRTGFWVFTCFLPYLGRTIAHSHPHYQQTTLPWTDNTNNIEKYKVGEDLIHSCVKVHGLPACTPHSNPNPESGGENSGENESSTKAISQMQLKCKQAGCETQWTRA
ncbi:uncharacterized protein LACBIDRAFT_335068 [Laccaria bicolor S238N-H82]|uniref:Predicted protein n=1 Tax=Laccaria bicolor (strain S238N-H82 / ATCC MYA-4686) TaxID=486041 RepID=B0E191_LACBS|nr:uncharacterized protein LACBIDRAFT_335068 [Laccaria bicolor S238N-H82]EDQ99420.1 predicted protein [Laccaria bicolor S238N-H82]|eukprot:XP_001889971.1 predicted protein [Laccaria bicolor S238N-H82]